jgi:uncharacterized protein YciI
MPIFARLLSFPADDPLRLEVRPAHREYVAACFERGEIIMSGPWAGNDGALIVYEAPSREAALALIAADPYATESVQYEEDVREWNVTTPRS